MNAPGAQVYVMRERTAVVVPAAMNVIRLSLGEEKIKLPENNTLYNLLRDWGVVEANEKGKVIKYIRVRVGEWQTPSLRALIFPTERLFTEEERRGFDDDVDFTETSERPTKKKKKRRKNNADQDQ